MIVMETGMHNGQRVTDNMGREIGNWDEREQVTTGEGEGVKKRGKKEKDGDRGRKREKTGGEAGNRQKETFDTGERETRD